MPCALRGNIGACPRRVQKNIRDILVGPLAGRFGLPRIPARPSKSCDDQKCNATKYFFAHRILLLHPAKSSTGRRRLYPALLMPAYPINIYHDLGYRAPATSAIPYWVRRQVTAGSCRRQVRNTNPIRGKFRTENCNGRTEEKMRSGYRASSISRLMVRQISVGWAASEFRPRWKAKLSPYDSTERGSPG